MFEMLKMPLYAVKYAICGFLQNMRSHVCICDFTGIYEYKYEIHNKSKSAQELGRYRRPGRRARR